MSQKSLYEKLLAYTILAESVYAHLIEFITCKKKK